MDLSFHFIIIMFFMIEFPPMLNTRTTKAGHRPKPRARAGRSPCVGAKFIQVGSFRFWKRVPCHKRRSYGHVPKPEGQDDRPEGATQPFEMEEMPSAEGGPQRNEFYDPNYGYEPYWADGEWVFDKRPDDKNDSNYMCGTRCSTVYQEYGKVCGRNKIYEYRTFDNYCQMKSHDCGGKERWMMLYRGKCYRRLHLYQRNKAGSRVKGHINSFMDSYTRYEKYVGFVSD